MFENGQIVLRIEIDSTLRHCIGTAAQAAGLSEQAWVLAAIHAVLAAGSESQPMCAGGEHVAARDAS